MWLISTLNSECEVWLICSLDSECKVWLICSLNSECEVWMICSGVENEPRLSLSSAQQFTNTTIDGIHCVPIRAAVAKLVSNLKENAISLSLLSQYMPNQYNAVSEGTIANDVEAIIINRIQEVVGLYARACKMSK